MARHDTDGGREYHSLWARRTKNGSQVTQYLTLCSLEHLAHEGCESGMRLDGVPERKPARPKSDGIAFGDRLLHPSECFRLEPRAGRGRRKPGSGHHLVARSPLHLVIARTRAIDVAGLTKAPCEQTERPRMASRLFQHGRGLGDRSIMETRERMAPHQTPLRKKGLRIEVIPSLRLDNGLFGSS